MYVTVPIALFGWIPLILVLFAVMRPRVAVLTAFLVGWMFLPMAQFKIEGIPAYSKVTATNAGVLLGVLLFDAGRVARYRPRWVDLPMAVWCVCSYFSSIHNGLGPYDGMSATVAKILTWGLPYFIGRIYLTDLKALKEMAVAMFVGGLVYMPFTWLEMKISPQLHRMVYGYFQHDFVQTIRFGGYRPMVFMQHGLMVSMWMATASLAGLWLWRTGAVKRLWGMPVAYLVAVLMVTTVMCRSMNAMILMSLGIAVLYASKWFRTRAFLVMLVAVAPLYLVMRTSGTLDRRTVHGMAAGWVARDRLESLDFRLENEDLLVKKAMQEPWLGWGGWNRSRVVDEDGITQGITDGLWVIAIGENGLLGLSAITAVLLVPAILFGWRMRVRDWTHPLGGAAALLAVVAVLHMIDNLPNGMFNPVYVLGVGGLAGLRKRTMEEELEEWDWQETSEWAAGPVIDAETEAELAAALPGYGVGMPEYR